MLALMPTPTEGPGSHRDDRLRVYVLAVAVVFGALLIASTTMGYRTARDLAATVTRGEAEAHFHAFHRMVRLGPGRPGQEQMAVVLEERRDLGLRYLAVLDRQGRPIASAGDPLGPPGLEDNQGQALSELTAMGARIRTVSAAAPPRPDARPGAEFDPGPRPAADGRPDHPTTGQPPGPPPPHPAGVRAGPPPHPGRGGPRMGPRILIEIEPVAAPTLLASARTNLFLGVGGAVLLVGAAMLFWRLSRRANAAETEMFERRHLAVLGELSAVMAHEIRNPLSSLKGHAQLLREVTQPGEPAFRKAEIIIDEAVRLETLTSGLLDFARSGQPRLETVDPRVPIRSALDALGSPQVEVRDTTAPTTWRLDPVRVQQALTNLVDNAMQASPAPGTVTVTVLKNGDELVYEVADHGPGVSAEQRERVFDPFVTGRTRGTGLGLSVVKKVAEMHGGRVDLEVGPAGGSRFRIHIPGEVSA